MTSLLYWSQRVDEGASRFISSMSLPRTLEIILSVPGNWFGLSPILLLGPLWVGVALERNIENVHVETNKLLSAVASILTIIYFTAWMSFLRGNLHVLKHAANANNFVVYLAAGNFLAYWLISDPDIYSQAIYGHWLWLPTLLLVMILKHQTNRTRPCVNTPHHIPLKHFSQIPTILAKHESHASFPSGDVASAMVFAIPLFSNNYPIWAIVIVALACIGRVYFLAHHVVDTIAAIVLTWIIHFVWTTWSGYYGVMTQFCWWHLVLQQMTLLVLAHKFIGPKVAKRRQSSVL